MTMLAATSDIARLRALVDEGDDSVLPILADALEEAGDARAAGLRSAIARGYAPCPRWDGEWSWHKEWCLGRPEAAPPSEAVDRINGTDVASVSIHASRSAAFLALAAALSP